MAPLNRQKILVPVDFSEESLQAVDVALEIAEQVGDVHVVHVLRETQSSYPDAVLKSIDHAKYRNHILAELRKVLPGDNYKDLTLHVEFGDAGYRISDLASTLHVGMIVIPSHGRRGMQRLLIGSVAERVVRLAHCPVLVLRK